MRHLSRYAGALSIIGVACTTVRPIKPLEYIPQHYPDVVWVTAADSTVVPLTGARVVDDTLRGMRRGTQDTVALALTDVRIVTAKVPDHKKTAFVVVGLGTLTAMAMYEFAIRKQGDQGGGVNCGVYQSTMEGDPGQPRPDC